jgi:hypothetical protein
MGFELRSFRNPFDFFPEFRVFPRVVLLVGFVLWFIGLYQAVSFRNPTVVLGTALILFAVSCHYFGHRQAMSGFWCGLLALLCFLWFVLVSYGERAPHWVQDFWRSIASLIWR